MNDQVRVVEETARGGGPAEADIDFSLTATATAVGVAGVETEDDASRVTNTKGNTTGVAKNGSGREEGARAEDTQR